VGRISRQRKDVAALVAATAALALLAPSPARATPVAPNDPGFPSQWAEENTGQPIPLQLIPGEQLGRAVPGTPFADTSASDAWAVTTGSAQVVIGEVDTGVDYEHPDLAANIWSNPGGIGECKALAPGCGVEGKCAERTHGYSVLSEACSPLDEDSTYGGHGTHVAGILGAVGGNRTGIAGMNWKTTILPVKWLDNAEPEGEAKKLIAALRWLAAAKRAGVNVHVVNDSATYKGTAGSPALREAIEELGAEGILFVTAAGNTGANNGLQPRYPCSFDLPNEICVAASNDKDELPPWASYGQHVALAAPGLSIYSTLRQIGEAPSQEANYGYLSGSSMAAAQVAGAAALILSVSPSLWAEELRSAELLKTDILQHVDKLPSLEGKVETAGRLDVCRAIPGCVDYAPSPTEPRPPASSAPPSPPPAPAPLPPAVIGSLKISPSAFKAAKRGPIIFPGLLHSGATVSYTDWRPALSEFTVLAPRSGIQNAAKKCVAPPRHAHGKPAKRCIRWVSAGKFRRADSTGRNSFRFSAHIGRSALAPGRYRLLAVPVFNGRAGVQALAGFRIVR
jgi:subtilisin family serine protease